MTGDLLLVPAGAPDAAPDAGAAPFFHPCPVDPACPHCRAQTADGDGRFDWSFVDRAYCISLVSRPDRMASAARELHRVGLCRRTLFYRPVKDAGSPIRGIWESHRAVLADALAAGAERALVLEDDVLFTRGLGPRKLAAIGRALRRLPEGWTLFFLGHWPLWAYPVGWRVLRAGSGCCHAYVASRALMGWLAAHPFDLDRTPRSRLAGKGIDSVYARLPGAFAFFPMVAIQSRSPSDHLTPDKRLRRLRHLVTRTRLRPWLLSGLMKPNEYLIVALSPLAYALQAWRARKGEG